MEHVGIFYGRLVHFAVFCYIFWTFGIVRGNLVYILPFWFFVPRKIWQPKRQSNAALINVFEKRLKATLDKMFHDQLKWKR
jgi:hypothetical protein